MGPLKFFLDNGMIGKAMLGEGSSNKSRYFTGSLWKLLFVILLSCDVYIVKRY